MLVTEIYKGQGLGNQLWCYAVTRAIARRHGYEFGVMSPENFKCIDFMDLDFGRPVTGGSGPEGGPPTTLPDGIAHYYKERLIRHPVSGADISTYDPDLVNVPDDTKIDGTMQGERYLHPYEGDLRDWLSVRPEFECLDYAADDICVINFRGGEYAHVRDVFLPQKYWDDAVRRMREINPRFHFVVVTDDPRTASRFFPHFEVRHFGIARDFVTIKNAKYLILANTSFAWFPARLSTDLRFCIAPKYWWAHNSSDGYWACDFNLTSGWSYLDRDGGLHDHETCLAELTAYKTAHEPYYRPQAIEKSFLVVSSYDNDLAWVPRRTRDYLIYDRSDGVIPPYTVDQAKIVKSPNVGYNLYDYFTFVIDHYDELPERTLFAKGNVFPRHCTEYFFDTISNREELTPIIDRGLHAPRRPVSYFAEDGLYHEINNSWYLDEHPVKYFYDYNEFLAFCYEDAEFPEYVAFAPGANYIVPRETLLRVPRVVYENLRTFVSYTSLPGEAHILERALYTLWTSTWKFSDRMLRPVGPADDRPVLPRRPQKRSPVSRALTPLRSAWHDVRFLAPRVTPRRVKNRVARVAGAGLTDARKRLRPERATGRSAAQEPAQRARYRESIKVVDAFYFFNELELLEIRLNVLDPYVDQFVVVEATETFSGNAKPLVFQENRARFARFDDKIVHLVTSDTPKSAAELRLRLYEKDLDPLDREIIANSLTSDNVPDGEIHWLREFFQKESLKKALRGLHDDDFCYISDVDEIWNPSAPIDYTRDDLYKYRQSAYFYYLNNRSSDDWRTGWTGTVATKYKNIRHGCVNHLRTHAKNDYTVIPDGGWPFTFQGGADRIRLKLESYGHQEFNNDAIKTQIEDVMARNRDYRGRRLKLWVDESGLPPYLLEHRDRYSRLFRSR